MKICAATMVGPGSSPHGAWESVTTLADGIVDTAPGMIEDFSASRNELLEQAAFLGYDWAIMLDTDERILVDGTRVGIHGTGYANGIPLNKPLLEAFLSDTTADVLMVRSVDLGYEKEKIFRLPARGHFKGPTHECFVLGEGATRDTMAGMTFTEEPKTPEQYRAKAERDRDLLEAYTKEHPDDPRWWYYLGDTYAGLGQPNEATTAFRRCWELNGWDEESAWAAYRIATIAAGDKEYDIAIEWCCSGMQRHPGMAELPWLAGWCCYQLGRYQHAIWWSNIAEMFGEYDETGVDACHARINFRYEPALYEAPYDVERWAYRAMGRELDEEFAEKEFLSALEKRKNRGAAS